MVAAVLAVLPFENRHAERRPTRFDALVVRDAHPRIWLDPARVDALRAKVKHLPPIEVAAMAGDSTTGLALAAVASGVPRTCHAALEKTHERLESWALLYDWCHDELSPSEKQRIRARLVPAIEALMANRRLWRSFHNAGHTAAYELALSALALQGDDPIADRALAFLAPELEDMMLTFDSLFPDGEWAEGADYARHASQLMLRTLLAYKTATGVDLLTTSPHLRNVAQYVFYATKPDGKMLPNEDNDYPFLSGWEHIALLIIAREFRDPHARWFLAHSPFPHFQLGNSDRWAELLFAPARDDTVPAAPLDELPLARIFRGKGLVIAKSGWGHGTAAKTWVAFSNGDYFGDHDHYDVNAFQIFHRGNLAIDSGRYDDDWDFLAWPHKVRRSQFFNYYQRTIAHNTMLVRDPDEDFGDGYYNDGGQRILLREGRVRTVPEDYAQGSFPSDDGIGHYDWTTNPGRWERGNITAYASTPDFVFVRGDGTKAYAPKKLSAFTRELLFLRPSLVVVFDRVLSTNAAFEKTWLLHTVDEPVLAADGSWFEVKEGEGRLFGAALLPGDRRLRKVGGPGNEFLVDGVKLRAGPDSELKPSTLHFGELPGGWRIEEQPSASRLEDYFANVMLLTERSSSERPEIEIVRDDASVYVIRVRASGIAATLRFTKGAMASTSMTLETGGRLAYDGVLPDTVFVEGSALATPTEL